MKIFALVVVLLLTGMSVSFAEPSAQGKACAMARPEVKMFEGKVCALVAADAAKNVKASVTVADARGVKEVFEITPATVILDPAGKALATGALVDGIAVKVTAGSKDKCHQALSIKVAK